MTDETAGLIHGRAISVVSGDVCMLPTVDVSLRAGEALIVRGPNGAGKSTLLKVLAGMMSPSSGSVTIAGHAVSRRDLAFRSRVAAMIGLPPMASDLTVLDHVHLVAATWFADPAEAREVTEEVLASLRIRHLGGRFPHELSTGQLQLAGLSLVLARPFDVLVLDEPEQRLDVDRLTQMSDVLAARRDRGASLVIATHSSVLTERLADRVLDLGQLG